MRVLHVVPSLRPDTGGPARSVPALCRSIQQAGAAVALYTFRRRGAATSVSSDDEPFPIKWFEPSPGSRQLPTFSYYRQIRRDVQHFDLVHLHSLWNPAISVAAFACRRAGVPYVLSPRNMLRRRAVRRKRWLKAAYYWGLERRTIRGAHMVHLLTPPEAGEALRFLGNGVPHVVVPNGIDPGLGDGVERCEFRNGYPSLNGKRIILFLGRLHGSKGLDLQARSIATLVKDFPDIVWVLVGPDAGERRRLFNLVKELGLEDHVLWTGLLPRERCLEALADAEVFLLTSHHEGHSMAMNEALALGVPVVLTDTVGFDEIDEWGAGHVVPQDPQRVAAAIADILKHPERASSMRQAGRRLVAERLAWPMVAKAMLAVYEEVLADRRQKSAAGGNPLI